MWKFVAMKLLNFEIKFFKKFTFDVSMFASNCYNCFIAIIQLYENSEKKSKYRNWDNIAYE